MTPNILWFKDISKDDVAIVGGKGANLGEMTAIGMPVPPGFVVTAAAYRQFLTENNLVPKIHHLLTGLDVNKPTQLQDASHQIQKLLTTSAVPEKLAQEMIDSYLELCHRVQEKKLIKKDVAVAVRSSATSEDSKEASFAGQNETFLNIVGEANLVDAVRRCWASLFEARSIFYRVQNHFDHFNSYIAVVVQVMIDSAASGIIFSLDPVTNNRNRVVIESVWGLGEYIVQGKVTPDHYEVAKSDLTIVEKKIVPQKIMLKYAKLGGTEKKNVSKTKIDHQKIPDPFIKELAKMSLALEKHYYFPQDSEFAIANDKIYLVQTRPITTIAKTASDTQIAQSNKAAEKKLGVILQGAPASPGIKSGPVKILHTEKEANKLLPGEILVAPQTNPDYVPAMKKAAAIITDKGGRTSHAAIVSRELGIPAVVGTGQATSRLKDGQVVTVDGEQGKVYQGAVAAKPAAESPKSKTLKAKTLSEPLHTATKVYINLAEPEEAKTMAAKNCDGIGLLRAEFMLAGIGVHPKKIIKDHKEKDYIQTLTSQMTLFAEAFYPRPVVYRTTDFKTNEYRSLKGGEAYEPQEANPMIGFRGAYRYVVEPDVFKMELEAIKNVRKNFSNLWLMIPFCRTVEELVKVKEILHKNGLQRSNSFKLWLMCEIPSNVILLDQFIEAGIDGISVGSNDLTMLTLGVDRDNENVASEYNELDPAVLFSFYKIIKTCHQFNVTCSMCGQAPSDYPDLTEKLVKWGITSVSVNPDVIDRTREIVYEAEKKLVTK